MPAIHEAGYQVVLLCVVVSLVLSFFIHDVFFIILLLTLNAFVCYFFRDPVRVVVADDSLVLSPADGVISFIKHDVTPPAELGMGDAKMVQISIYLNIFNVHVNRAPISGVVKNQVYSPGKFRNMYFARADEDQDYERNALEIQDSKGNSFVLVQIAGFIARRIVCDTSVGDNMQAGHRFGIIRFGSRVDLYLPSRDDLVIKVHAAQTVVGGETLLAKFGVTEQHVDVQKVALI